MCISSHCSIHDSSSIRWLHCTALHCGCCSLAIARRNGRQPTTNRTASRAVGVTVTLAAMRVHCRRRERGGEGKGERGERGERKARDRLQMERCTRTRTQTLPSHRHTLTAIVSAASTAHRIAATTTRNSNTAIHSAGGHRSLVDIVAASGLAERGVGRRQQPWSSSERCGLCDCLCCCCELALSAVLNRTVAGSASSRVAH